MSFITSGSSTYYKKMRDLDSVVLPVGLKEDLIKGDISIEDVLYNYASRFLGK